MKNLKGKILYLGCIISLFYATSAFQVKAQGLISGRVMESESSGAAFATVSILNVTDSVMVKGAITDEEGNYALRQVPGGNYLIAVSSVGFEKVYLDPIAYDGSQALNLPVIKLQEAALALGEVVVNGQRPVMERKSDRYVMDVTASSFQADNLMDIFRALPFVQVQGDGISVNGRAGILIVLDNVQMPGATMSAILENMTGDEVQNIEFITNPSSRYPANINSVIKITTKKSKNYGLTGSARGNFSQGRRFKGSSGTSMTYRKEKWVADLNLNFTQDDGIWERNGYRMFSQEGTPRVINETMDAMTRESILYLRGKLEYNITKNHKIGVQSNSTYTNTDPASYNRQQIGFSDVVNGRPDSLLLSDTFSYGNRSVQNYSTYYSGKLDSLGKQLDVVLTYSPLRVGTIDEMRYQDMVSPEGGILNPLRRVRNNNISQGNIFVTQIDLELPFKNGWNMTAGSKIILSSNKTRPTLEVATDTGFVIDDGFSFRNDFEENIYAVYSEINKEFGKTNVSAGVRMEKSSMQVDNLVNGERIVSREFLDFFPTLQITRPINDDVVLSVNYRETISRPGFTTLTPYRTYIDDYTIIEGNPALRPEYNRSISMNGVIKNNLFIELEYKKQTDAYTNLPTFNLGATTLQPRNFNLDYYSTTVNYSFEVAKWWSGSIFAMGAIYNGEIFEEQFEELTIPQSVFKTVGVNSTFSLPKGLTLDMAYSYQAPFDYGLVRTVTYQYTRIALKGHLFNKNLQYTIAGLDLFRQAYGGGEIRSFDTFMRSVEYHDSRRVQLGLVYRFGKRTVKGAQQQKLGNEDVIYRAN
ncbi:outer membrane beta-barrel protein [Anditalea andensis]|uniref:Outer membrane protein beta-barrel domain-containing protein n=1 Tax=Anditalea andensis TaxID=1048983 RepID=A0A074L122_9BACT|nr:outer membrane beta-barrel protein [Anditalea andensis]KEO75941.1 hypothetical protein EL17_00060 [Anditalea andensis]